MRGGGGKWSGEGVRKVDWFITHETAELYKKQCRQTSKRVV